MVRVKIVFELSFVSGELYGTSTCSSSVPPVCNESLAMEFLLTLTCCRITLKSLFTAPVNKSKLINIFIKFT